MAWPGQKLVVFRASFPRPGFGPAGAQRDLIGGDAGEERAAGQSAMTTGTQRTFCPGLQAVEGALETEACDGHIVGEGGFQEQRADEIQTSLSDLRTGGMTSRFDSPGFGGKNSRGAHGRRLILEPEWSESAGG